MQQPHHDVLAEARLLRQHKGRLEARMQILEDHNRQLETQLKRLKQLLSETPSSTLQTRSVTASQLNQDTPARVNQPPPPAELRWTEQYEVGGKFVTIIIIINDLLDRLYFDKKCGLIAQQYVVELKSRVNEF